MPFGSRIKTFTLANPSESTEWVMGDEGNEVGLRQITVPEADPPWWWSEYLTEEWKRDKQLSIPLHDGLTTLQREQAKYEAGERVAAFRWDPPENLPRHEVWK